MPTMLYDILLDISKSSMIDDGDLRSAGLLILTAVTHGLQIQRAGIWLFAEDKQSICGTMLIDGDECTLDSSIHMQRKDYPRYFASLDSDRAVVANDALSDPTTAEFCASYLRPFGISSLLDAPIRHRGNILGILCCEHQAAQRNWSSEEIAFASALADTYGRAISAAQRNDYERQLKDMIAQLEQKINVLTQDQQDTLHKVE